MLRNESIRLRPIERDDLSYLTDLANDPVVRHNVVGWDWPFSLAGQERWFDRGVESDAARRFLIETVDGGAVGLAGLWDIDWHNRTAVSGLKLGGTAEVRGRGYGRQALGLLMDFAFLDVGLRRLTADVLEYNRASLKLHVEKFGWVREGLSREHVWRDGQHWDVVQLGILRDEYLSWRESK